MSDQQCAIVVGIRIMSINNCLYHFVFISIDNHRHSISQPCDGSGWRVACQTFESAQSTAAVAAPVSVLATVHRWCTFEFMKVRHLRDIV